MCETAIVYSADGSCVAADTKGELRAALGGIDPMLETQFQHLVWRDEECLCRCFRENWSVLPYPPCWYFYLRPVTG